MGLLTRFLHKKKAAGGSPDKDPEKTKSNFRGVQVVANGEECCQVVRTLANERFLLEQAPMLPLSLCDADICQCTYEPFDDRRADIRRASDIAFDMASELYDQENRSKKMPGRRSKDRHAG